MDKRDCFAYMNGECNALTEKNCDNCNFYKRKFDFEKALKNDKKGKKDNV